MQVQQCMHVHREVRLGEVRVQGVQVRALQGPGLRQPQGAQALMSSDEEEKNDVTSSVPCD